MSKPKREYTTEFKQKAVELSHARGNAAEVCTELGLNGALAQGGQKIQREQFPRKGGPQAYR